MLHNVYYNVLQCKCRTQPSRHMLLVTKHADFIVMSCVSSKIALPLSGSATKTERQ